MDQSPSLQHIQAFIDAYWPLTPEAQAIHDFIHAKSTDRSEAREKTLTQMVNLYENMFLRTKYGGNVLQRWDELTEQNLAEAEKGTGSKAYDSINTFLYETGLTNDSPVWTLLRGRKTLESLLLHLHKRNEPFTLVDAGCGDGKIALGLALYLPQLVHIHAIDRNTAGLACFRKNRENLSQLDQKRVASKITLVEQDYIDLAESVPTDMKSDIFLAAHPLCGESAVWAAPRFTKPNGTMIAYYPDLGGDLSGCVYMHNLYGASYGVSFLGIEERTYWLDQDLRGIEGTITETS